MEVYVPPYGQIANGILSCLSNWISGHHGTNPRSSNNSHKLAKLKMIKSSHRESYARQYIRTNQREKEAEPAKFSSCKLCRLQALQFSCKLHGIGKLAREANAKRAAACCPCWKYRLLLSKSRFRFDTRGGTVSGEACSHCPVASRFPVALIGRSLRTFKVPSMMSAYTPVIPVKVCSRSERLFVSAYLHCVLKFFDGASIAGYQQTL